MMKIFKRDLLLCAATTTFVILCAIAWGAPFVRISSQTIFSGSHQARVMVFHGAVLQKGSGLILRDSSGAVFQLDNPQSAQSFAGKTVTIDGRLELKSKTIHIEHIEPAA
jgi:hypothetical protein